MYRSVTLALTTHDLDTLLLVLDLAATLPGGLTPTEVRLKRRLLSEKARLHAVPTATPKQAARACRTPRASAA